METSSVIASPGTWITQLETGVRPGMACWFYHQKLDLSQTLELSGSLALWLYHLTEPESLEKNVEKHHLLPGIISQCDLHRVLLNFRVQVTLGICG